MTFAVVLYLIRPSARFRHDRRDHGFGTSLVALLLFLALALGVLVASRLPAAGRVASALTRLYERAKFSAHETESAMKADAISSLESLRDELGAASRRDRAEVSA